jgi:hypothetical protein
MRGGSSRGYGEAGKQPLRPRPVLRWVQERGHLTLDLFVDQVVADLYNYRALYEGADRFTTS